MIFLSVCNALINFIENILKLNPPFVTIPTVGHRQSPIQALILAIWYLALASCYLASS